MKCCDKAGQKLYGLYSCKECGRLNCLIHSAFWTDKSLRCSNCFSKLIVDNYPNNCIIECNNVGLAISKKPIALIVIDGLYVAGVQKHCLILIDTLRDLNIDSIVVAIEGGGMWASKFIDLSNCTIINTIYHELKWKDIYNALGEDIVNRIVFASSHLVEPTKWSIKNIPKKIKLIANFHSEPSEHEIVSKDFLLEVYERSKKILFPANETLESYKRVISGSQENFMKFTILNNSLKNEKHLTKDFNNLECLTIGVVSRVDDDKFSIPLFIDTVLKLKSEIVNFKIIVAGDGESMPKLKQSILIQGLENYIELKGFVLDIENIYQIADLIFLPSKRESMPYAMLESLSYGLAIVMPNSGFVKSQKVNPNVYVYKSDDSNDARDKLLLAVKNLKKTKKHKKENQETQNWAEMIKSIYEINKLTFFNNEP